MNIQQRIRQELENPDFPNLEFLYSPEVLEHALEVLEELLEEEKKDFEKKLIIKDEDISFEIFQDTSLLDYFFGLLEHYQGVHNDETIRNIIETFEPKYIAFGNEVAYSRRYYKMLKHCYENLTITPTLSQFERENILEQKRILEKSLKAYEVRGIALSDQQQDKLKNISERLSELSQKFSNNILDSQKVFEYIIKDESIISQMPEDDRELAKNRYEEKIKTSPESRGNHEQKTGPFLFDASINAYISIMKYCSDSAVRKHFYESRQRFGSEGEYNNRGIILQILSLRKEKSQILGYANYAELSLECKMAESPQQIIELFGDIAEKAKIKAMKEIKEIQEYFSLDELQEWDVGYYARKLKEEKYALDEKVLKEYFEFERVREGMFEIAKRLYGIEMKKIYVPHQKEDEYTQVYEVYRNGKFLSYFMTDYFYHPLKRNGAWANILRENSLLRPLCTEKGIKATDDKETKKLVINVANFQKGVDGRVLLTLSDVETMFHEFGHALHEILSQSRYPELSGFHVEWDFVELPSQLLENWCRHEDGMKIFAQHYQSGKTIPRELLAGLKKLETFATGSFILRQNTFAMIDMDLHSHEVPKNAEELDQRVAKIQLQNTVLPTPEIYTPHVSFSHIFDGGYSAGYYSYMWAEIIEKEVWRTFCDTGDIFSASLAQKFYDTVLSQGTKKPATELFYDFLGRKADIEAFLQEKGL